MEQINPENFKKTIINLSRRHGYPLGDVSTSRKVISRKPEDSPSTTLFECVFYSRDSMSRISLDYYLIGTKFQFSRGIIREPSSNMNALEKTLCEMGIEARMELGNGEKIIVPHINPESFEGIRKFLSAYFQAHRKLENSFNYH